MKKAVVLLALGLGLAGCNDGAITAAPAAESPTPGPTTPPGNEPPVAQIAGASSYAPLATATFDGGNSYDPDGTIANFAWAIVARPAGSASTIQPGATPALASFFVDLAGDYTLELTVTDNQGATGSQQLNFSAVPSQDLHVELTWVNQYTKADMDLHLINKSQSPSSGTFMNSSYDCDYTNCKPPFSTIQWWNSGSADDATLDIDNITESVPENINIATPHDGAYEVDVHYYGAHATPAVAVDVTVNIYIGGTIAWSGVRTIPLSKEKWTAATINWANGTGTVTPFSSANNADITMTSYGF